MGGSSYLEKACLSPDDTDQVPSESDRSEDDMPDESDAGCDGLNTRAMLDVVRNRVPGLSKADVMKRLSEEERNDEYSRMSENLIALILVCNIPSVKCVELPVWSCVVSAANGDEDFQFPHWFRESEKAALLRLARHGNISQSPTQSIPQDPDELFSPPTEKDGSLLFGILPDMIDEDIINDDGCASAASQLEQYLSHPTAISFSGRKFVFQAWKRPVMESASVLPLSGPWRKGAVCTERAFPERRTIW